MAVAEPTLEAGTLRGEITLPARWQHERTHHTDQPLLVGETVEQWKLLSVVYEGEQSILYAAGRDDQAEVLVKLYQKEKEQNQGALRRVKMLKEPALVPLLSYGIYQGMPFEVSPYLKDGSLEQECLSEEVVVEIVLPQLMAALRALHQMHILHNDIKPANLLWKKKGTQIALGDYSAISLDSQSKETGGTPAYMAPEVLFSHGKRQSRASDYCSVGLTLMAFLGKSSPLSGKTEREMMRLWQQGLPYPEQISPRLSALLRGLTRYDPAKRMDDAAVQRWLRMGKGTGIGYTEDRTLVSPKPVNETKKIHPLLFKDQYILDIPGLVEAAGKHWEYGTFMLKQHQFDSFLIQFDSHYYQICKECARMFDPDEALFVLLHSIHPRKEFYWCKEYYQDLEDFASRALAEGKLKNSSPAVHFCRAGLLKVYLEKNGATKEQIASVERLETLAKEDPDLALTQLLVSMNAHPEFSWHGETFYSLEDVAKWLLRQEELDACVEELYQARKFEAWLDFIKQGRWIPKIKGKLEGMVL